MPALAALVAFALLVFAAAALLAIKCAVFIIVGDKE
jgi:hypothetical protein